MLGLEDIAAVLYGHVLQKVCDDVKRCITVMTALILELDLTKFGSQI